MPQLAVLFQNFLFLSSFNNFLKNEARKIRKFYFLKKSTRGFHLIGCFSWYKKTTPTQNEKKIIDKKNNFSL